MNKKIVILGATGMLGSAVYSHAVRRGLNVRGTTTNLSHVPGWFEAPVVRFTGSLAELEDIVGDLGPDDLVVNCVGLIKHHIIESVSESRQRAIALNSVLPHQIDALARERGYRVVQIATDCVYSGRRGGYSETDPFDADDVYGQTKALGEVPSPQVTHLRASIIGRELRTHRSLVDWAVLQPPNAEINGYTDHFWNGVTTVAFARIAVGLIEANDVRAGTYHLIPSDTVSKFELLRYVLDAFDRQDVRLVPRRTEVPIDRTLITGDPHANVRLWAAAEYPGPPTIEDLVRELALTQSEQAA